MLDLENKEIFAFFLHEMLSVQYSILAQSGLNHCKLKFLTG
jgi:hypothetical protein